MNTKWVQNSNAGNFKSKINKNGTCNYYPLFRLVFLKDNAMSSGLHGDIDDKFPSLPNAVPPWQPLTAQSLKT
jgi:hypothetical protein